MLIASTTGNLKTSLQQYLAGVQKWVIVSDFDGTQTTWLIRILTGTHFISRLLRRPYPALGGYIIRYSGL